MEKSDVLNLDDIKVLVNVFYDKVREDELLAPIFNAVVKDNWTAHLEKMYQFWETVLFAKPSYRGSPFLKHANLPVEKQHFDAWIKLFNETVDDIFVGEKAEEAKLKAFKMSEMFQYKLDYYKKNPDKKPLA